jgi:hypothetical protein
MPNLLPGSPEVEETPTVAVQAASPFALSVVPGEKVILFVKEPLSLARAASLRHELDAREPNIEWVVVNVPLSGAVVVRDPGVYLEMDWSPRDET